MKAKTRTIVSISFTKKEMLHLQIIMEFVVADLKHDAERRQTAKDFLAIYDELSLGR